MKRICILILGLGFLLNMDACGPKEPATPAKQCRLTTVTERYSSADGNSTNTKEYRYDATGNVIQILSASLGTNANGSSSSSSSSDVALTYDGDGYLTKIVHQYSERSSTGQTTSSAETREYTYTNGRLSKVVFPFQWTNSPTSGTFTTTYEYDEAGKPLKVINEQRASTPNNTFRQTYTFANGILNGQIIQYENGLPQNQPIEYNAQGNRARSGDANYFNLYIYDTKNRKVREEVYDSAKLSAYSDYTFDDRPSAYTALPKLKGHPVGPNFYGFVQYLFTYPYLRSEGADYEYPLTRIRQGRKSNRTSQFYQTTDWVRTPVYGTNGLPESLTHTFDSSREDSQGRINTIRTTGQTTFTYENCPN